MAKQIYTKNFHIKYVDKVDYSPDETEYNEERRHNVQGLCNEYF